MKKLSVWAFYHLLGIVLLAFASLTPISGDPIGDDADGPVGTKIDHVTTSIHNPGMAPSTEKSERQHEGLSHSARLREDHGDMLAYCDT
jgi:hypothetical protein